MIYLCKPTGVVLGLLNGIDEESASLTQSVSDPWELSFTLQRYIDGEETTYYSSTTEMMELLLDTGEEKIRFQIDSEPEISGDGVTESKEIIAHSIEIELQTKFLHDFKINCGTKDSLEYLVGYYDNSGNFVNVNMNPYLNLPIDYIKVQNDFVTALAKVKTEIQAMSIQINSSTGLVQNIAATQYLNDLLTEYPRLGCDIVNDEVRIYLHKEYTTSNTLGYNMYIPKQKTKAYLLSGIDSLISFYRVYGNQLSLIDLAIENAHASGWTVGDIPEEYRHMKCTFNIESQDILSFLKKDLSSTVKLITDFDRYDRKVNLVDISKSDEPFDTGVYLSYRNLVNSIDITSSSDDGIRTKFIPTGANNLGILYANFGEKSIIDLNWFMNKVDEYGEYQYVSDSLRTKYNNWINYRDNTPVSYTINGKTYSYNSRRDAYRELTKIYNQYIIDIDAFKNRLPNDGCNIDYTTFSFKELNIAYKAYMNALEALEQLYMSSVGAVSFERSTQRATDSSGNAFSITDSRHIKNTWYWYDFDAYYYTIIPNVMNALKMYVLTDANGTLSINNSSQYDSSKGEWIEHEGGNPWYNGDSKRVTESKADSYLYDVDLYGIVELEAKKKAWMEAASVLYRPGFVLKNGTVVDPIPLSGYTYNVETLAGYNKLSDAQKEEFTDHNSFIEYLGKYLDYVSTSNNRYNSLTRITTKGVIVMAQEKIDELQTQLDTMESQKDAVNNVRKQIADSVLMENWSSFTAADLKILYTLIREANYSNENILITNLNDIASTVDVQKELYEDAVKALTEKACPQLSFSIELDNLFAVEEFKSFKNSVKLLNFIRVSIDLHEDIFVKLRIVSIERNPFISTEDLKLTFSNMTYSLQDANDLAYMFGLESGSSSGRGSGGGSGGVYGTNDAEIQIGNNMLNALLSQSTYAAAMGITAGKYGVYDAGMTLADNILDVLMTSEAFKEAIALSILNQLTKSGRTLLDLLTGAGLFNDFRVGNIVISGRCITDYIKSSNYTGSTFSTTATAGSFIDLKLGRFNFGGGNITFDGTTLSICKGGITYNGSVLNIGKGGIVYNGTTLNIGNGGIVYNYNSGALTLNVTSLSIGNNDVEDMIEGVGDIAAEAAAAARRAEQAAASAATTGAVEEAAKSATNFLSWSSTYGLIISGSKMDNSFTNNIQILADGINFRHNVNTINATISGDGFKVFDGVGSTTDNMIAFFGAKTVNNVLVPSLRLGKSADYNTYIDNSGIYMKYGTKNLMQITKRTENGVEVADIDTTGMYKINGVPVLTKNGFASEFVSNFKTNLSDAFMIKKVTVIEDWNISAGDWEGQLFSISSVLGSLANTYNVLGIVGYDIANQREKGQFSKIMVLSMDIYTGSSGTQYIDVTLRNNSARKSSHINVYVSLLLVKKSINLLPETKEYNNPYNAGDNDDD